MTAAARAPLTSRPLLFVDLETTGSDPLLHEIIEIAAVRVHPTLLFVERELVSRVRPIHPERCSMEMAAINGFDPQRWDDAPPLEDVLARLLPLAEGCILAGHNVFFDREFLAHGFRRTGLEPPKMEHHAVDVATLAWPLAVVGALDSMSLAAVCDLLGVSNQGAHSARRDVERTIEVYRRLMSMRMAMPPGAFPAASDGDEEAILATQAARLAEGHSTYGVWRADDGRNNAGEALIEVLDALNYCAAELLRLAREKGQAA